MKINWKELASNLFIFKSPSITTSDSFPLGLSINPHFLPCDAVRKQKKSILEDLFSSVISQFKKYQAV